MESVADRVETMSSAFLGLTVGCAKCHDHKFDPFTQREYFGLFAFFDGIDESGLYSHFTDAVPTPALDLPSAAQAEELAALDRRIAALEGSDAPAPRRTGRMKLANFDDVDAEGVLRKTAQDPQQPRLSFVGEPTSVARGDGHALLFSGEDAVEFPSVGVFQRWDAFSIALRVKVPEAYERAVIIHRTKSWTDSGSRGYQVLIEEGKVTVSLVHFWPGDAIAIRSTTDLPVDEWTHVGFTYDGSSRASGLRLYINGALAETEVIRDRLTRTIRGGDIKHLGVGSRFRDRGFKGGLADDVLVAAFEMTADEMQRVAGGEAPTSISGLEPGTEVAEQDDELRELRRKRDELRDKVPQIMTMREAPDIPAARRTAFVLRRGDYSDRGEEVPPLLPAALPALIDGPVTDRHDLARWLTHPDHPLTARVHADRVWRFVFGRSLVATPEDFGAQCPPPVHRALLDHLARELIDTGWDTRRMIRRLVRSQSYRMSSIPNAGAAELDPNNELFSRAVTRRLSAEEIRDGALHASGLLDLTVGGKSVFPYQPPGLWQEKRDVVYPVGRGKDLVRRSLYTFWRRTSPPPTLGMFDAPSREACVVQRQSTSTPLQTLALWNDPQFVASAVALARRAAALDDAALNGAALNGAALNGAALNGAALNGAESASPGTAAIEHLFLSLASRLPTAVEADAMAQALRGSAGCVRRSTRGGEGARPLQPRAHRPRRT